MMVSNIPIFLIFLLYPRLPVLLRMQHFQLGCLEILHLAARTWRALGDQGFSHKLWKITIFNG